MGVAVDVCSGRPAHPAHVDDDVATQKIRNSSGKCIRSPDNVPGFQRGLSHFVARKVRPCFEPSASLRGNLSQMTYSSPAWEILLFDHSFLIRELFDVSHNPARSNCHAKQEIKIFRY
ncbi:MAG: hypothetical protein ABIK08_11175 [Pseudomonadota bacterium]